MAKPSLQRVRDCKGRVGWRYTPSRPLADMGQGVVDVGMDNAGISRFDFTVLYLVHARVQKSNCFARTAT